jgi:branched-chain amino acid transport system ATP-binding protein/neutral amino acid transport system ATP-binding protein
VTAPLEAQDLRAGYGRSDDIIRGISLTLPPESITAVIGPNGSGKSTFVKTLAGLVRARGGRITLAGTDVTQVSPARRAIAGLAYVPQEGNVFRGMSVGENLRLATEFLRGRAGVGAGQEAQVRALFGTVMERREALAGNLSGGQRQMLACACALLANPDVLLLDEPSAGLSPRLVAEVMAMVQRVRDAGITVLLVEQNVRAALAIADHAAVLVRGQLVALAPAAEIAAADLGAMFLGRAA